MIGSVEIYWKNEIGWTHKHKWRIPRNGEHHYMPGDNNRAPARLIANKETGHNIYDINRGVTYRNINTELITVIPRTIISRKL